VSTKPGQLQFLEAKALQENLDSDRLTTQIISYAGVAGVQWVVLSNGDEYRVYNSVAPVPIEEKLFRKISVSQDDDETLLATLTLLSRANLQDRKIGRMWASHFVDRQVEAALKEILNPLEPTRGIVRAIKRQLGDKVHDAEVKASLRRARFQIDFPVEPDQPPVSVTATPRAPGKSRTSRTPAKKGDKARYAISLVDLIAGGALQPPTEVFSRYRGHEFRATILPDGSVVYKEKTYSSLSIAAGVARKPYYEGAFRATPFPPTNGWLFWQIHDPVTGKDMPVDVLRQRYLAP